jgi:hypothetical protein
MPTNFSVTRTRVSSGKSMAKHDLSSSGDSLRKKLQSTSKGVHSIFCPASFNIRKETLRSLGEIRTITAGDPSDVPLRMSVACNCAELLTQAANVKNATSEEISFIHLVSLFGAKEAAYLAPTRYQQYLRPSRKPLPQLLQPLLEFQLNLRK